MARVALADQRFSQPPIISEPTLRRPQTPLKSESPATLLAPLTANARR